MRSVSEALKIYLPANDNEHVRLYIPYIIKQKTYSTKYANLVLVPTVELHYILNIRR
jgi:hypothetical protein